MSPLPRVVFVDGPIAAVETELLVLPVFDGELAACAAHADGLEPLVKSAEADGFQGRRGESLVLGASEGLKAKRLGFVGAGKRSDWSPPSIRGDLAAAAALARQKRLSSLAVALDRGDDSSRTLAFAVEGAMLSGYRFDRYRRDDDPGDNGAPTLDRVTLVAGTTAPDPAVRRGQAIAAGVALARDLTNEPPSVCTPNYLVETARQLAHELGLEAAVLEGVDALEAASMGMFAAVARGSEQPPALIHLTYRPPDGSHVPERRVALVGKGVTYDSGGYSLKPPASQLGMHGDMAGAAAVLGAARTIGLLKPSQVEVHFIVPTAENLVSGAAYKVNDIVQAKNGMWVEIVNTDAEGRLLLGDALTYAEELGVDEIVDIATLTGANVIALGGVYGGVYCADDDLAKRFLEAGEVAGESLWRLPLDRRLDTKLKSIRADLKNSGGRYGSGMTAALFLANFVSKTPWLHVDMAGMATRDDAWEHIPKGGTGYGTALLARFALGRE